MSKRQVLLTGFLCLAFGHLGTGPATAELPEEGAAARHGSSGYRITGDRDLRPQSISDDGVRMYIEWHEQQDLPAVFAVTRSGEAIVEGYMRSGVFVIDRVYHDLVFRIDKRWAKARKTDR